jgi:prevent-host-death family protein
MKKVSVAEARRTFRTLLDEVSSGHEVIVVRRGQEVARLVPPKPSSRRRLPPLASFRASIRVKGEPMSRLVARVRRESRY